MQKVRHLKQNVEVDAEPVTEILFDGDRYQEWCVSLPKFDVQMLSVMLYETFKNDFKMGTVAAADKAAAMCDVTGRTSELVSTT